MNLNAGFQDGGKAIRMFVYREDGKVLLSWGSVWGAGQWRPGCAEQQYLTRARSNRNETRELDIREP